MTIHFQIHTFEMTLYDTCLEVSHRTDAIGLNGSFGVLHHKHAVLIVSICNSESTLRQHIKESLLRITIVLYSLMIIQMVASQIGEDTTCKLQSTNTLLGNGMTRALHEDILTTGFYHTMKQFIQFYGIWCCMTGGYRFALDIVAYRREQSTLITQFAEHII